VEFVVFFIFRKSNTGELSNESIAGKNERRTSASDPTIWSYNAGVVKSYNTASRLARFETNNIFFCFIKTLCIFYILQFWSCSCKRSHRRIGSRIRYTVGRSTEFLIPFFFKWKNGGFVFLGGPVRWRFATCQPTLEWRNCLLRFFATSDPGCTFSGTGLPDGTFSNQKCKLGNFWRVLQWKMLVYFTAIWYI
jgi:hypothetical protein